MASFEATRFIQAAREDVFAYRLNVHTLPEYNPGVARVRLTWGDGGVGSRYAFPLRLGPVLRIHVQLTVVVAERSRRILFRIDALGTQAEEECFFDSLSQGTQVRFRTSVQPLPVGPLESLMDRLFVVPNLKRQTLGELDLMKRCIERRAPAPRPRVLEDLA